jgi:hypothetical protein
MLRLYSDCVLNVLYSGGGGLGYEAMGGITNFSSLIDGVERLPNDYWTHGPGVQILQAEEDERAAAAGYGPRKLTDQSRANDAVPSQSRNPVNPPASQPVPQQSYGNKPGRMPSKAEFEQGAKVPVGKFEAKLSSFDPDLVEIGGVYMPIKGKMSADQEFAIYDQKYQKSVCLFVSELVL